MANGKSMGQMIRGLRRKKERMEVLLDFYRGASVGESPPDHQILGFWYIGVVYALEMLEKPFRSTVAQSL